RAAVPRTSEAEAAPGAWRERQRAGETGGLDSRQPADVGQQLLEILLAVIRGEMARWNVDRCDDDGARADAEIGAPGVREAAAEERGRDHENARQRDLRDDHSPS